MTPLVMRDVPAEELDLFQKICLVVREMPDVSLKRDEEGFQPLVSCHMVARAFAAHFPVQVKDGYFNYKAWPHSWLLTVNGFAVDLYPWTVASGPMLVYMGRTSPWRDLYCEDKRPKFVQQFTSPVFLSHVAQLTEAVGATLVQLRSIVPVFAS